MRPSWPWLLALPMNSLCVAPAAAQQEIGRIEQMVEILDLTTEIPIRQATDRVQIWTGTPGSWVNAAPRARVRNAEVVRVARRIDARVVVRRATHRGTFVLLPELMGREGDRVFPPEVVGQQVPEGRYALDVEPEVGDLRLRLEQGALVVDWIHGRLMVEAAGTRTVIVGTRVALSVNLDGDQGLLYLETGAIQFPDHPEVRVGPGEFVHLRSGLAPVLWPTPLATVAQMRDVIGYHNREVWPARRPPLYRRPVVLVSAAVVTGALIYAATARDDGDGNRSGTVIVRIPF